MRTILTVLLFFFLTLVPASFAAEINFSSNPEIIKKGEEVVLDVSISGAQGGTVNYVRASFFHQDSPTSYFGYVYNHLNEWYNGTPAPIDPKKFLQVEIGNEGSWSGKLKVKIDESSPSFKGNGRYYLKVGRYTASAGSVSNWSEQKQIEIQGVDPTSTPTLKPTPTSRPVPTKKPTSTPRPLQSSSPIPTLGVSETSDPEVAYGEEVESITPIQSDVLGEVAGEESLQPTKAKNQVRVASGGNNLASLFTITGAMILIIGCGILLLRAYRKQKQEDL